MFSTLMFERHGTKIAIFGGKPGEQLQYKGLLHTLAAVMKTAYHTDTRGIGMAGNQVLEWTDLDDEIKTAGVKNVCRFASQ